MTLFIANLNFNSIESDLQRLFTPFGEVKSVVLLRDKWNNRSKGAALVDMPVSREAEQAMSTLHNTSFAGKVITVTSTSYEEGYR